MEIKPINQHIGRAIRRERRIHDLTLKALADKLDISYQQLAKYEHGKNRLSVAVLLEIARVLGVPVSKILEGLDGKE